MNPTSTWRRLRLGPWNLIYLVTGFAVVMGVAYMALRSIETFRASAEEPALGEFLPSSTPTGVYLLAHMLDSSNDLFRLDPASGRVEQIFDAFSWPAVVFTDGGQRVYVYDVTRSTSQGSLSLVDVQDSAVVWEIGVPGFPWVGSPDQGAWLSRDEKRLYLLGTGDGLHPHIYTFDTETVRLLRDNELQLPYPTNEVSGYPQVWKLPWAETLIVVTRDQLFPVDLASGSSGEPLTLFRPEDSWRVPRNLARGLYALAGDLDPQDRRLFLATSTQEILSVDLGTEPFTVDKVFSLSPGWQFVGWNALLVNARDGAAYVQVRRNDTPIVSGLEVEEIWLLDMTRWVQAGRLNFREHGPFLAALDRQPTQPVEPYPKGFGVMWSENEGKALFLTQRGLLSLERGPGQQLTGRWMTINWGGIPEPFWYTVLP